MGFIQQIPTKLKHLENKKSFLYEIIKHIKNVCLKNIVYKRFNMEIILPPIGILHNNFFLKYQKPS